MIVGRGKNKLFTPKKGLERIGVERLIQSKNATCNVGAGTIVANVSIVEKARKVAVEIEEKKRANVETVSVLKNCA